MTKDEIKRENDLLDECHVAIMVARVEKEGLRVVSCNQANAQMTGYSSEELIGTCPDDTTLGDSTDTQSMNRAMRSANKGEPGVFASLFTRKDGKPFAARCLVTGRFDENGTLTHYVFVSTPINPGNPGLRWFGAQGLLAQAEQVGGTGAWRFDFETEELICSDNCYALFGLSAQADSIGRMLELIPKSEFKKLKKAANLTRETSAPFEEDCTYYRADGTRRDGLMVVHPECNDQDEVIALIGVLRDETEVRALRRRQEMYLRAARIGFLEIDLVKKTVSYSAEAGELIGEGRSPGRVSMEEWKSRVHPDDFKDAWKSFNDGIKSKATLSRRYRFLTANGEYRWMGIRATSQFSPGRDIPTIMGTIADIEERVRSTQQLEEVRARLDLAVDSAAFGLWSWDLRAKDAGKTDKAMSWSPHVQKILGLDEGHKASWEMLESLIHPEERTAVCEQILASAENIENGKFCIEHRCIRPDGTIIWVENRGLARQDEKGRAIAIAGALHDITERKRATADLIKSEQRFHDVTSITGECIFELDAEGRITYLSDAASQIYGYDPAELIGTVPTDLVIEKSFTYEEWICQARQNKGWKNVERHIIRKDKSRGWVTVNGRAVLNEKGEIIGYRGAITDTTEQHVAIEQLKASEHRIRDVVRIANGAVFDLDTEGNITYISDNATKLFGARPEDLIGKPTYTLAPAMEPRHHEWLEAIRNSDGGFENDLKMSPLNGKPEIWARTTCRVLTNDAGDVIGYRGIAFDITARKQAVLETIKAKKAAEAAAEERSRFLSTMSHEIRTPLNAIIGMTDLLLDMPQSDEQTRLTSSANTAGKHLLSLVNDILDFSKLDAGKLDVEKTPFDLQNEVDAVKDMLAGLAKEKSLSLDIKIAKAARGNFIGDPSRIRQILVNLINNAIKFTDHGSVAIQISKAKDHNLRFTVTDTGTGIDPAVLPNLFQDFSQADTSITRKFGGTGLGLAICKRLIDVMNGKIGADSVLDVGSTFWFEVPLQRHNVDKKKTAPRNVKPSKQGKLHILVAEDNPANQLLIKTILTRMGQTLVMTNNGEEAVEAALTEKFDIILMDVQMPVLDGVSATRRLREEGCDTPVIALTAHIVADEQDRFAAAGMDAWLSKPFDARKLAEAMFYWAEKGPQSHTPGKKEQKTG